MLFHLSEQNFEPINQRGSDKRGCTVKRQSLLYQAYKYQPCFHGTSLHLTELTDDISLCSYLIEHIYLSAFYKKNHNCDDQKAVVILVILFECVVAIM